MEHYEHGGNIYDVSGHDGRYIDFSANINPFGLSEKIRQTLIKNINGIINYPDPNATELRESIAKSYNVPEENLVLLNGATEFFYLYLNAVRPERIMIPVPSFSEYERAARAARCEVFFFRTKMKENFSINIEELLNTIRNQKIDCLIVGRPNNPTGNLISIETVLQIAGITNVIVDESFIDFINVKSLNKFVSKNISVVHSLTKIFAIPGLRLGFAVVSKNLAYHLNFSKDVWNVNFLSQKAGVTALGDKTFLKQTRLWLKVEKNFFVEYLKKIRGITVFESTANFVLFKLDTIERTEKLLKNLKSRKILLRSCANFVGLDGSFLRSAIRSRQENILLLKALEDFL